MAGSLGGSWRALTLPQSILLAGMAISVASFFGLRERTSAPVVYSTPPRASPPLDAPHGAAPAPTAAPIAPVPAPSARTSAALVPPGTTPSSAAVQQRATEEATRALAKHRALMIERCIGPLGQGQPPTEIHFRILIDPQGRELGPRGVRDTLAEPRIDMVRCLVRLYDQSVLAVSPPGQDLAVRVSLKLP